MINLVPELAERRLPRCSGPTAASPTCSTIGARHLTLRQLDMPANFFAGNNCVAESGQLPSNFLLGVSTPGNDIRFRRQMRSRLGVPITVAGNPPVKFGSADFGSATRTGTSELPSFPLFLGRVALNDLFSIGLLPIAEVLAFAVFYTVLLRSFGHPVVERAGRADPRARASWSAPPSWSRRSWSAAAGARITPTSFWSWRHFTYFFAQDCFFVWCRRPMGILAGTVLSNLILRRMGCRIGRRTLLTGPLQAFDWNAVSFGDDCVVAGLLQLHSFENMTLRVKRTEVRNGSALNFGSTVMGGAVIEPGTTLLPLSLVLKEMSPADGHLRGQPRGTGGRRFGSRCPRCRSRAPSPTVELRGHLKRRAFARCPLRSRGARQAQRLPPEIGQGAPEPLHRAEAEASGPPLTRDDLHGEEDHRPAGHGDRSQPEGLAEAVAVEQRGEHQGLGQVDGQRQTADRGQRRENGPAAAESAQPGSGPLHSPGRAPWSRRRRADRRRAAPPARRAAPGTPRTRRWRPEPAPPPSPRARGPDPRPARARWPPRCPGCRAGARIGRRRSRGGTWRRPPGRTPAWRGPREDPRGWRWRCRPRPRRATRRRSTSERCACASSARALRISFGPAGLFVGGEVRPAGKTSRSAAARSRRLRVGRRRTRRSPSPSSA